MPRTRAHTRRTSRSNPRGVLSVRSAGFGFVQTSEGEYFIPASKMNGAFDGDMVELAVERGARKHKGGGGEGASYKCVARVVRVVERAHAGLVGRFEIAEPFGVVVPADPRIPYDIFTQLSEHPEIPNGSIVRVAITEYPSRKTAATGTVVEVLGDEDDERVPIDLIVARHKLETKFGEAALEQAQACEVDAAGALAAGYRDLRERVVFTIDPDDARDFDDAVSFDLVKWRGKQCARVGVHIADVAAYVPWGSSIDLEARRRATSVYLVDRVLPMLPEKLSNDVCSLRPGEERRTMTVDMVVNEAGRVVDVEAYPAVIRSNARLTYGEAQQMLESASPDNSAIIVERLCALSQLAKKRIALREAAGGLDFDTVEAKVRLDDAGVPQEVVLRERTDATSLIEECMIMANESVATLLRDAGFPCLFRVHEKPSRESLEGLIPVLQEFPWFKDIDAALFVAGNQHQIQLVLEKCAPRPEAELVTSLVLRAMKRAIYSPELSEHYALASVAYAHFTSPIRRYPDLVVHRMLKAALGGRPEKFDQEVAALPWLAEHSSQMERIAELAARESQEVKIVELMESHVGENFSAMIAGVATYGMFVRLENTAEGMVEMADIGREYFALDPVRHTLTGSDSGRSYRLGQHVAVKLVEADRRTCHLRFKLL